MNDGAQVAPPKQQTDDRSPIGKLPTELWLIILNMVVDFSILPLEHSNHVTFPYEIDFRTLRGYRTNFVISRRKLRQVCRTFNALLASSRHFVMRSGKDTIPSNTRALYFDDYHRDLDGVALLGPQASICQRLVYINTSCTLTERVRSGFPISFDLLCTLSQSLPSIRSLALRLLQYPLFKPIEISFWSRLSRAFPHLLTLEVALDFGDRNCLCLTRKTDKMASFERLEVFYMNSTMMYTPMLHPNLRHVAIGDNSLSDLQLAALTQSPLVESVLLQVHRPLTALDVRELAHLRVLGVLMRQIASVVALSPNHRLEHFWIYVDEMIEEAEVGRIVNIVLERMPGISQITFDPTLCNSVAGREILGNIRQFGLSSHVWQVRCSELGNAPITLQRILVVPQYGLMSTPIGRFDDPDGNEVADVLNEQAGTCGK